MGEAGFDAFEGCEGSAKGLWGESGEGGSGGIDSGGEEHGTGGIEDLELALPFGRVEGRGVLETGKVIFLPHGSDGNSSFAEGGDEGVVGPSEPGGRKGGRGSRRRGKASLLVVMAAVSTKSPMLIRFPFRHGFL